MKSTEATLVAVFVGLALVTESKAEDYYFYEGPKGELVISNKEPPPGSKTIKRWPEITEKDVPQAQEPGKAQPNVQAETSPKPSKTK